MATNRGIRGRNSNPMNNLIGIAVLAVFIIAAFFLLRGIFRLLYFLAPVLLIITLIVDYKVVLDYIKQLGGLFKRNFLYGLGAAAFTFFLYPIVFLILMIRALTGKNKSSILSIFNKKKSDDYTDYEIVDEELELKDFEKVKEKRYDGYFREE